MPCPAGTFSNSSSITQCFPCAAGNFSNATAASSCHPCPFDSFSLSSSTFCTLCPAGTFSNMTQASNYTQCYSCSPGHFSANAGSSTCTGCSPGFYSSSYFASNCNTPCAAGYYSPANASMCFSCPSGTYSNGAASSCTSCPVNTYNHAHASSSCLPCPVGTYQPGTNPTFCLVQHTHCAFDTGFNDTTGLFPGIPQGAFPLPNINGTFYRFGSGSLFATADASWISVPDQRDRMLPVQSRLHDILHLPNITTTGQVESMEPSCCYIHCRHRNQLRFQSLCEWYSTIHLHGCTAVLANIVRLGFPYRRSWSHSSWLRRKFGRVVDLQNCTEHHPDSNLGQ